jgi:hypothetical protein
MSTPAPIDPGAATEDDRPTRRGDEADGVAPATDVEAAEGDDE